MASLYQVTEDYSRLLALLETAESEEETEAIWSELEALDGTIAEKAEIYAKIIKNKQAEAMAFKAEKDRLFACQKSAEGISERLKNRLLEAMERLKITDIQTDIGKWQIQKNPASCTVTDESKIPAEFRIPQPDKIDRAGIIRHFRATGEIIPGCEVSQETGIRFR